MKIFITGVAGFLGSHLAERMLSIGHEVLGNDNLIGGDIENYEFSLYNAYPNPFNPSTTIGYELPYAMSISLNIYDISGRLVKILFFLVDF